MGEARITVSLGASAYDIVIGKGGLDRAGEMMSPLLKRPWTVVVTDDNVRAAHGEALDAALGRAGIAAEWIVLKPGEATKSFAELEDLSERLIAFGVERSDLIIAFGGGVVGDLAGFAAAIVKRGCRYAQIPTTLLAQVDSAVGGKTAINAKTGKNLVGAFHQPAIVIADPCALATLPRREIRAGFAEIVKYAALGDADFFAWLESHAEAVLAAEAAATAHAVKRCCEMKAAIVAEDERETGRRALLNLGHTFGHALEAASGYSDKLLHGEAVAAGMALAFDYSVERGLCADADAKRLKTVLANAGLPIGAEGIAASGMELLDLVHRDKKAEGGSMTLILARGIGQAFIERGADEAALAAFLNRKTGGAQTRGRR